MKHLTLESLEARTLLSGSIDESLDAETQEAPHPHNTEGPLHPSIANACIYEENPFDYPSKGTNWGLYQEASYINIEDALDQIQLLKLQTELENNNIDDPRLHFYLDRWNTLDDPIVPLLQEKFEIGKQMGYTFLTYGYAINTGYTVSLATPMLITCKNTDPLMLSLRGGADLIAIVCAGFELHSHSFDNALGDAKIERYDDALDQYNHAKDIVAEMTEIGDEIDDDQVRYLEDKRSEANAYKASYLLGQELNSASSTRTLISGVWATIGAGSLTNLGLEHLLKDPIIQAVTAIEAHKDNYAIKENVIKTLKEVANNRSLRSSTDNIIAVAEQQLQVTLPEAVKQALKEGVGSLKLYQYTQYLSRGLSLFNSVAATTLFANDLITLWNTKTQQAATLKQATELSHACDERTCTDIEQDLAVIAETIANEQNPNSQNMGLMWTGLKWSASIVSSIPTIASMGGLPRYLSGPANSLTYWGFLIGSVGYAAQGLIEFGLGRMLDMVSWSFTEQSMGEAEGALRGSIFKALDQGILDKIDITASHHNTLRADPDIAAKLLLYYLSIEQSYLANLSDSNKRNFTLGELKQYQVKLPVSTFLASFSHAVSLEDITALADAAVLNPDDASALLRRHLGF
tara:strand:+ start:803 stop:2698 length:1896 start_codon:yes stop_codon:yes gene_type:complete